MHLGVRAGAGRISGVGGQTFRVYESGWEGSKLGTSVPNFDFLTKPLNPIVEKAGRDPHMRPFTRLANACFKIDDLKGRLRFAFHALQFRAGTSDLTGHSCDATRGGVVPHMTKPNDYVTDLFKKLREDISGIKHKLFAEKPTLESAEMPRQYSIRAVHEDRHSRKNIEGSEQMVRAMLHLPEAIRVEAKTEERHKQWFNDRTFVLSIAGVGFAALVALIYYFQLREMQNQTRIITQQMLVQERAWMAPTLTMDTTLSRTKPFNVTIHLENTGQTPAKSVQQHIVVQLLKSTESPKVRLSGFYCLRPEWCCISQGHHGQNRRDW